jgi:hypothetical protein
MRLSVLLAAALLSSPAAALACANDYSGTQRTLGFDYEIEDHADLARTTLDFLNAASNWLYFTDEGAALRNEFVNVIRIRDLPIHLPACNDIGQCASVSVRSEPYRLFGIDWPGLHKGFTITASFGGLTVSRFIQADSAVAYNFLSAYTALDKRCRDNNGNLIDAVPDDGDEEDSDESEEDAYNDAEADWEDEFYWEDSFADEEEGEPCSACQFYFDADEDGELDPEPYDPTEEEDVVEV